MIGELAEEASLRRGGDTAHMFHSFDGGHEVGIGTGATDTGQELRDGCDRFAFHGRGIESFELIDLEMNRLDMPVLKRDIEASRTFDLGHLRDIELTEFGYLMHRSGVNFQ